MAIWGRNILVPATPGVAWSGHQAVWWMREMLLVGGWTENSNNGDAAWSTALNVLATIAAGPNGLSVLASAPRVVTSPVNVFTSGMVGAVLSLFATANQQNRSMWRITKYIDEKNVEVDTMSFSPYGWADESGMAARITVGNGTKLGAGAWVLMDSPAGSNLQTRLVSADASSSALVYVRPKGKIAVATEVGSAQFGSAYYTYRIRLNFYFDGFQALMYWLTDSDYYGTTVCQIGQLLDVDAADTDPGFISGGNGAYSALPWNYTTYMLDGAGAQILAYPVVPKTYYGQDTDASPETEFTKRLKNGRPGYAALRSPWVVLANTLNVGACVRGRLPLVRYTYTGFEKLTPLDSSGDWLHLHYGLVVPRNGPYDQMLVYP